MSRSDFAGASRRGRFVVWATDESTRRLRVLIAPARFNNLCRWAAVVCLLVTTVPMAVLRNIRGGWLVDFPQYYMGGTVALHGEWDALYPLPNRASLYNPGDKDASTMNPRYAQLAAERGVPDSHRFIQMPLVAILLAPLALLPYPVAAAVWVTLSAFCAAALAWLGGSFYRVLAGEESFVEGIVTLGIALFPGTRRALNPGNISPIVALLLALSIRSLLRSESRRFAIAAILACALKYASLALVPILIAMQRWRTLLWTCTLAIIAANATVAIVGIEPCKQFIRIFLLTNRPWLGTDSHNQAIWSLVYQCVPINPLPDLTVALIKTVRWAVLTLVMVLSFKRHRLDWQQDPSMMLAGCAAATVWLLIFSPIFWVHYILYLLPLVGWLAWEIKTSASWLARVAASAAIFFISAPYTNGTGLLSIQRQPMAFHGLWAALLILAVATRRLSIKSATAQAREDNVYLTTAAAARALTERRRLRPAA